METEIFLITWDEFVDVSVNLVLHYVTVLRSGPWSSMWKSYTDDGVRAEV